MTLLVAEEGAESLYDIETDRNEKDGEECSREHAADDRRSQDLARNSACAFRPPQRHAAKNESKCSHQDWSQPYSARRHNRFMCLHAFFDQVMGELDDQNTIR